MDKPNIQTTKQVVPMLYGYSTPEVVRHNGWTKIGYTEQDVETRINQQTHTADIKWQLEWKGNATFDDGSGETFIDKDFHAYLRKSGIEQEKGKNNEWFHVDGATSKQRLYQSDEMKKQFPDNKERLKHIFEKQVYGLAPTEIIYKIATSYILGFDEDTKNIKHNFRQLDALPYAKDGTLEQVLDELYPESE